MFPVLLWILALILALSVNAQQASQWCDSVTNICFTRYYVSALDIGIGYLFPPLPASGQPASTEFIGIFTAPIGAGWIGNSLGGGMVNNLLIVGWVDGSNPVVSARLATSYSLPAPYPGPVLTVLGSSGTNSTHQRIVYRCQNCTTWTGGTNHIVLDGTPVFGYAANAAIKPDTPSNPNSNFLQHTAAGQHGINTTAAHSAQYSVYLQQLLTPSPTTTPPTSAPPTSTPPTTTIPVPTGALSCPGAPQPTYALVPATGWQVTPVLGRLTTPRGIAMDTAGHLLVVQRGLGISIHTLDTTGCVVSTKTLVADTTLNHGIDVIATKLFASSADAAFSWDYNPTAMTVTNKKTLVTGMNHDDHITRTLWNSRKYPNLLIVSSGSNANIDLASFTPATGRAMVKVFDLTTLPSNGVPFASGGTTMGYGLRNDVGIVEDKAGIIHSVENSCDDAFRNVNGQNTDVHTDNPAEKIYNPYFGGYPYCFTVWEPSSFRDKTFAVGDWFVQAPNSTLTDAWCTANSKKPTALLPPHTAPLDGKFGTGSDSAMYVSLHGSWDRQPPIGYKVVSVPGQFASTGEWSPSVAITSRTYSDILKNRDEASCLSGCFRPVGLAWSLNGVNLYVSSDTSGEVFLLRKGGVTVPPTTTPGPTTTPKPPTTSPGPTTTPPTTVAPPQPTQTLYGQCGGNGYTGPKVCASGSTCKYSNDWYSQCLP